jgi:hypothetical protein
MKLITVWPFLLKKKSSGLRQDHPLAKPPFAHFSEKEKKTISYLLKDYSSKE